MDRPGPRPGLQPHEQGGDHGVIAGGHHLAPGPPRQGRLRLPGQGFARAQGEDDPPVPADLQQEVRAREGEAEHAVRDQLQGGILGDMTQP